MFREKELFTRLEHRLLEKMVCFHVPTVIENMHGMSATDLELATAFCGRSLEKSIEARVVCTGFDYLSILIQLSWFVFCMLETNPLGQVSGLDFRGLRFSLQLAPCNGYFLFKYVLPLSSQESRVLSLTTRIKVTVTSLPNFSPSLSSPSPPLTSSDPSSSENSDICSTPPLAMSSSSVPPNTRANRTRSFNGRREARPSPYNLLSEVLHPEGAINAHVLPMMPVTLTVQAAKNGITSPHLLLDLIRSHTPSEPATGRDSWLELVNIVSHCFCEEDRRQFTEIQILPQAPPRIQDEEPLMLQQREQWISELEAPHFQGPILSEDEETLVKSKRPANRSSGDFDKNIICTEHPASAIEAFLTPIGSPMDETEDSTEGKVIHAPNLPFALPCDTSSLYIAPSSISDSCLIHSAEDEEMDTTVFTGGVGLGIFAFKKIPAKTVISAYYGQIVTSSFVNRAKGNFFNTHLVTASYSMGTQFDGVRYPRAGKGVASLVNSTTGADGRRLRPGNATFDDIKTDLTRTMTRTKVIRAMRDIQPGEEILIQYVWI
jgi:hypothetical protein